MMHLGLWPLLLPVAALSGYLVAKKPEKMKNSNFLSREYFVGLNYLLNEQPDKAVDIFIKLLEVDSETVETHLALGNLFRRRGEVDRAIRMHQNLIARPQLSKEHRCEALLELGRDYMSAGVLDRAERIFREVTTIGTDQSLSSLYYLLDIYQQEKSWEAASQIALKIESLHPNQMRGVIAHHYCELAEMALMQNDVDTAKQFLKKAFLSNKNSVRASLLQARLEAQQENYKTAIKLYSAVKNQNPDFLSEIIVPMSVCYEQLGLHAEFIAFLQETLKTCPRFSIVLVLAEKLKKESGMQQAIDFVTQQLREYPSLIGLNQLIAWHIDSTDGKVREKLEILLDITRKLLQNKPVYRCNHCGFSGKTLHWQCPGCKKWDTVAPIHGLEGD